MSDKQTDNKITSQTPDGRIIVWQSTDDALAFSAHLASTFNNKNIFFEPYKQVTGKRATMIILKEYIPDDATLKAIIERTRLQDGTPFADVLKEVGRE